MRKKLFYTATVLSFCLSAPAIAKDSSEKGFLNSDVFSLSKKKENAFDAASAIYVLSSEDIRRSGVTSIPEALRLVPGLQVARIDGNKWAISARGMNHQYSSKLLIMIDGRTVYTPIFSGAFWDNQDYVINDIDRIEVIRGPGASIWGANAMNGIINIITKSAAETKGAYVSQTFGNNDKSITEARYGGKAGSELDSYSVYAKHATRDGFTKLNDGTDNNDGSSNNRGSRSNNDGIVSDRAGFKYDILSLKDNTLSIHGDVFSSNSRNYFSSNPTAIASVPGAEGSDKKAIGQNIVVNWNKNFSKKSSITLQTYFDRTKSDVDFITIDDSTYYADFQHFYNFSDRNQFIWGLGYKNFQDEFRARESSGNGYIILNYLPNKRNVETYSAFIQDKIGIIADELYLTLGSKFEHNDQTGFEYQPNARLTYYPSRNQTLWTSVSRAVRTPTRAEDSIETNISPTLPVTRGNVKAESETVLSYEAGYKVKPTSSTNFDIAAFYSEYSRLGTFDADMTGVAPGGSGVPTATNNGRAVTYGYEVDAKWQVMDSWKLEASYDFIKMDIKLNSASNENDPTASLYNSDKLAYFTNATPRNQFRLRSLYDLTSKLEFDNMLYYVDSLPSKTNTERGVPSYIRWDTRLGYLATKNLDLSFGIQNLLDDRHQEFSAGLLNNKVEVGRTYYVKAALQF